ncbi:MAG: choice-of-anchor D domain-containing protein, partial [Candidatus Limnocylindrales bacterium]
MIRRCALSVAVVALLVAVSTVPPVAAGAPGPATTLEPLTVGTTSRAKHIDVARLPRFTGGAAPQAQEPLRRDGSQGQPLASAGSGGAVTSPVGTAVSPKAAPAATTPASVLILDSDPGDWIGQGKYQTLDGSTGTFWYETSGGSTPSSVDIGVTTWGAAFGAPAGQALAVGSYPDAADFVSRTPGQALLGVSGDSRGCDSDTGSFTVEDLSVAADGTLLSFAATFVQYCGGSPAALYGEVRYDSTVGWAAKEIAPSPVSFGTVALGSAVSKDVTITDTGTAPLTLGSFSIGPTPSSFDVTGGTCSSGSVAPSDSCTVTVTTDTSLTTSGVATLQFVDNTARGTGQDPISATFVSPPAVEVSLSGSGSGAVTSSPSGIDCGSTCSADFPLGSNVVLTASPAPGSLFAGWSGPCYGTGSCSLWPSPGANDVSARFEIAGPPVGTFTGTPVLQSSAGFAGEADVTGCGSPPCLEPPDSWVPVGPNDIVQATNVSIRISNRSEVLIAEVSLPKFFVEPSGEVVDGEARVIWDSLHRRWLAVETSSDCSNGYIYLAVSDSADPMGGWTVYYWSQAGAMYDYPGLGVSSDNVAISANIFGSAPCGSAKYEGAEVTVVDAASLIAEPDNLFWEENASPSWFAWRPAVSLSPGPDLPLVVGMVGSGPALDVGFARLTGRMFTTLSLSVVTDMTTDAGLPPFVDPPVPTAFSGASVNPLDARPLDALAQNGVMWFVSGTGCIPSGHTLARSCVRLTEVQTATLTVLQDFAVGQAGYDTFSGGIGLTAGGSLAVVWSQSSATSPGPISTYASYRMPTDPAGSLRSPIHVKSGAGTYAGQRWGDYVGVAQDPNDPRSVWEADEVSTASGDWATQLSKLTQAESAPRLVRYSGADRFATAAAVSAHTFGSPCHCTAYIATAYNFPDALAGAAAAGTIKGPVL